MLLTLGLAPAVCDQLVGQRDTSGQMAAQDGLSPRDGLVQRPDPQLTALDIDLWSAAMVAAALLAGADITVRAVQALRLRHFSIELLVTVVATGALLISEYWKVAAVTFLSILGSWLEARTMRQTRGALKALIEVAASVVAPGETLLVKAGQRIPVDHEVVDGTHAPQGSRHSCARLPSALDVSRATFYAYFLTSQNAEPVLSGSRKARTRPMRAGLQIL